MAALSASPPLTSWPSSATEPGSSSLDAVGMLALCDLEEKDDDPLAFSIDFDDDDNDDDEDEDDDDEDEDEDDEDEDDDDDAALYVARKPVKPRAMEVMSQTRGRTNAIPKYQRA